MSSFGISILMTLWPHLGGVPQCLCTTSRDVQRKVLHIHRIDVSHYNNSHGALKANRMTSPSMGLGCRVRHEKVTWAVAEGGPPAGRVCERWGVVSKLSSSLPSTGFQSLMIANNVKLFPRTFTVHLRNTQRFTDQCSVWGKSKS